MFWFKFNRKILLKAPCINEFAIIKPISRGAFGKVYLAYKLTDKNKLYAVKVGRTMLLSLWLYHIRQIYFSTANEKIRNDKQEYGLSSHN